MAYLGVPQSKLENLTTNVQIVNLSASFDGTTTTFNLQDFRGDAVYAVHERALLVILGGITQKPGVDYTTSGTTITFTTAPVSNLTIHIRKLYGVQRIIGVNDGVISPVKLSTGGPVWNSSGNVTISGDLNVTGAFNAGGNGLFWEDNEKANFGSDNDLQIYHSGVNSFIRDAGTGSLFIEGTDLTLRAADSTTRYLVANETNGDVSLFYGNNVKLQTISTGISVTGQVNATTMHVPDGSTGIQFGNSNDLKIYHNGSHSYISESSGTGDLRLVSSRTLIRDENDTNHCIIANSGGSVDLYHNGNIKLATTSTGASVTGNLNLGDDNSLYFGAGDDLEIKHIGGSFNNIQGSPELRIQSASRIQLKEFGTTEVFANFIADGAVELFYDNSKKFETTTTGAKVTGALEVTQEYPSIRPTLDLNFAATKTLDRRITFRRDSLGTYTDELGIVKYAPNNTPRFDHDPTTGESLGLLIEESRTNLLPYSVDLTQAVWTKSYLTVVFSSTEVAPDGTTGNVIITTANTDNAGHYSYYTTQNTGRICTTSAWFKNQSTTTYFPQLRVFGVGSGQAYATFNLSGNGSIPESGGAIYTSSSITPYPNGWYRCTMTFDTTAAGNTYLGGYVISNSTSSGELPSYAGSASTADGFLVWGFQNETGSFATSYIHTSGSTVTRAQDTAKITGTNFTDFYNQTEGTLVAHYYSTVDDSYLAQLENSSTPGDDRIGFVNYVGYQGFVETGNSTQAQIDNGTPTVGDVNKVAFAFKANDFAVSLNSASPSTDTSGTMPTVDRMMIGSRYGGAYDVLKSTIRHLSYYPKRLPNAQLQGLTQQ